MINVIDILHEGHSGGYAKSNDFKVGILGNKPQRGTFPSSFTRFPAKSLQIPRILTKFAMKLRISSAIVLSSLSTINLLIVLTCATFSFVII